MQHELFKDLILNIGQVQDNICHIKNVLTSRMCSYLKKKKKKIIVYLRNRYVDSPITNINITSNQLKPYL